MRRDVMLKTHCFKSSVGNMSKAFSTVKINSSIVDEPLGVEVYQ